MSAQSQQSEAIVRAEAARMGVSPAMAEALVHIMMAESSGNPNCTVSTSSAKGLFQILDSEWRDLCRRFPDIANGGQFNVMDPVQNTRAAIHMLVEKARQLEHNIGHPPSAGEIYLAHFAGLTGATRILRAAPNTPMTQLMSEAAISANEAVRYRRPDGTTVYLRNMTAADMVAWANHKMGQSAGAPIPGGPSTGTGQPPRPGTGETQSDNPTEPGYVPPRPAGIFESLIGLFVMLFLALFDRSAPRQTETPIPSGPDATAAPPAPAPRDPSTYIQPEIEQDLVVTNGIGVPDPSATNAQILRIFDTDGNSRVSEAEVLRFDLDHDGVLDLGDIPLIRERLQSANVSVPANASIAQVLLAFASLPPQTPAPQPARSEPTR